MTALLKLTATEAKLFAREPIASLFSVLFPTVILLALGAVPVLREPSEDFGGARFVEMWAPTALVIGIAVVGVQHIPGSIAAYREMGILRRMSTTPVHPRNVLLAQLIVALSSVVVSAVLLVLSAWLILDVPLPERPGAFALSFVVGFGAVLSIGMLLAAVVPTTKAANGLGMLAFMVIMFFGGVYIPRFLMPDTLVRIGDYTPPGIQTMLEAWSSEAAQVTGDGAASFWMPLAVMVATAIVAGVIAAKTFRWE